MEDLQDKAAPHTISIQFYRNLILRWFAITTAVSGWVSFIFGVLTSTNYWGFALAVGLFSIATLVLEWRNRYRWAAIVQIFCCNIAILVQITQSKSAYLATLLGLVFIIASIFTSTRVAWGLFLGNLAVIILYIGINILHIEQRFDPTNGIAYVDNVSVLLPMLFISFAIALIISKVLINIIQAQDDQYQILQKTQETLIHQKKLESIRILAGGIAHDFNNILTAILGNASLLQFEPDFPESYKENLVELEHAALQARSLTKKLLTFSKGGGMGQKRIIALPNLIRETADFAIRGRKARLTLDLEENLWPIFADEDQIAQVIQNMIINADEAMEQGGTVHIHAVNHILKPNNKYKLVSGKYVKVTVEDSGPGIPDPILPKIFDPFFTTKPAGTGLGLSICSTIITKHKGFIYAENKGNGGTSFHIFIPASMKNPTPSPIPEKAPTLGHYSGIAMILDDKETVKVTLGHMMTQFGFSPISFSTGEQLVTKLSALLEANTPVSLFVLDLTIPGEEGVVETAQRIRRIDPAAKILLSSGYAAKGIDYWKNAPEVRGLFDAVLQKPYTMQEISEILETLWSAPKEEAAKNEND